MKLVPALPDHTDQLFAFECENRAFFERWIAGRGDAYYTRTHVHDTLVGAVLAREHDAAYAYLVFVGDELVGRVNLRAVERVTYNRAVLGYRIGARYSGRGYATTAVEQVGREAFGPLKLWRLEAVARPEHQASRRVLERNGFEAYGHSRRSVRHQGQWCDLVHYECHRER